MMLAEFGGRVVRKSILRAYFCNHTTDHLGQLVHPFDPFVHIHLEGYSQLAAIIEIKTSENIGGYRNAHIAFGLNNPTL